MHVIVCKSKHGLEKKKSPIFPVGRFFLILDCGSQTRKYEEGFFLVQISVGRCGMQEINGDNGPQNLYFALICSALIIGCEFVLFVPNPLVPQTNYFLIRQKAVSLLCDAMRPKTVRWRKVSTVRNALNRLLSLYETRKIPKVRNVLN